eukprot:gnl/TRDRNA2_/TRDRNA2_204796_c0_seq1.p1 gnl/TRDRNA2_/TRDRNA2_204796_c0~~gnl/TRDRNA2_/TRDRNA2_204796_c0_seq1.p1  ORF type:complete len:263 (+),score=18.65 gnl/TRDRNA2_/TRDRNA2_204796_c0_seq1:27-815(+)
MLPPALICVCHISVLDGDWGDAAPVDICEVCESAARAITYHSVEDAGAPIEIHIERSSSGPVILYHRGKNNEYVVQLDVHGTFWAQFAYQFAHELCHLACNYREGENLQLWFEESLCECASLYSLQQMALEWQSSPPYPNWKVYSEALARYATDRISSWSDQSSLLLPDFHRAHRRKLEADSVNRELNGYIATKLLPLFGESPQSWQALPYLNRGPLAENLSFVKYLTGWYKRVPSEHRHFVGKVAAAFAVDLEISATRSRL